MGVNLPIEVTSMVECIGWCRSEGMVVMVASTRLAVVSVVSMVGLTLIEGVVKVSRKSTSFFDTK